MEEWPFEVSASSACGFALEITHYTVCGAQALAADVRRALQFPANIAGVMRGDPSISLHVEQFGY